MEKTLIIDGRTYRKKHAGFIGSTQVTGWDTRRDKVFKATRTRAQAEKSPAFSVHSAHVDEEGNVPEVANNG